MMKYVVVILMLLILMVGCAPSVDTTTVHPSASSFGTVSSLNTSQYEATQKVPPEISKPEPTTTQNNTYNINPSVPLSTVPVLPTGEVKVYRGNPPTGKYLATQKDWLAKSFRQSPNYGLTYSASANIAPYHFTLTELALSEMDNAGLLSSVRQVYENFGISFTAGSYMLPDDYFLHNLPYTLWSKREGWYIPTTNPSSFSSMIYYLSRNPPANVNYDESAKPYQRWYMVTEQDVLEWRMQELEDKINSLEQQQYESPYGHNGAPPYQ